MRGHCDVHEEQYASSRKVSDLAFTMDELKEVVEK
jgi:hypothetical protein